MNKVMVAFGIALCIFLFIGYAKADYEETSFTGSDTDVCVIAIKIDAAANAGSFSLFQMCKIKVYTMKACSSPINADVSGTMTRPTGIVDNLTFAHLDRGEYEAEYMFNSTGNYMLYVEAVNATWWTEEEYGGKVWVKEYISVPFLSMYLSLPYGTRYQVNDSVRIWSHVEDSNGLPINDADVNITVFYPNLTAYVSNQNMTLFANGDYYYTFTAPDTEGQYFTQVEARKNFSYQSKSKTFQVGGWASQIGEMNETLHDTVVPYLQDINQTVYDIKDIMDNLNFTASNINYLIYELVKEINETQGKYNVTVYNDSAVQSYTPGFELKQVIWRYDNETKAGVSWIRYRACANDTYNFTGTLDLTNVDIINSSCYNCSGGDVFSVGQESLNYTLITDYEKGWDIKVKLRKKTGIATYDGFINGTRHPSLSYLGNQSASELPFSFYVATTKLSSTVFGSLEMMKDDVDSIITDLDTIMQQIDDIEVEVSVTSGGSSGGSRITNTYNYYYNATNNTKEILEELLNLMGEEDMPLDIDLNEVLEKLQEARNEIMKAMDYYNEMRKEEATGLAALFSGLETSSTLTMLLGLVFVILVVGVFLYLLLSSREEEDSLSKILLMKLMLKKKDKTSKLMAYSILSGKKSHMDKLFKFMITKDILEGDKDDASDIKSQLKYEVKKDLIMRIKDRLKR